ncbi:DUF2059 domain-containing protein [Psychrobacter sp. FDAARGOS_221]|uniref:DUF2059 domain-containing protein n=1 Tax=Psychrobacter sp. FDAARGOS_221 TaxID=1975705 RepID=UPI000BB591D3|nr:DUF2059 domain-containing protein [Psychrobacter sp. FDAARGOS_221]PNK59873.1 DUF2059 domain-containing protein [Psychrobacter sp. FDAARGOS_221]
MKKSLTLGALSLAGMLTVTTPALAELTLAESSQGNSANKGMKHSINGGGQVSLYSGGYSGSSYAGANEKQVPAQIPTDASLLELMEVMRMTEMMQSMTVAQGEMMDSVMQSALQDKDLQQITETQRQQMVRVLSDYTQELMADSNKAMIDIVKKHFLVLAKQHYTQAEVDAQIAFYSSDIGQRILDKQPTFMQAYMKAITPETMDVVNQTQQKLKPKLKQELERILR